MYESYLTKFKDYTTFSIDPDFPKEPLKPYYFIARHEQPRGLFQVI